MTTEASTLIGGVDTDKHTHYAAAVDQDGRLLGHQEFPATDRGYQRLLAWIRGHGQITAIGVESTGSFGATLTRALTKAGERVVEVNRPNRQARRMDGKSDRLDAEQIARAVLGQTSTAIPKAKSGTVEVIRTLRVDRASAVKARTQAFSTLWGIMIGAPSPLRDQLVVLTKRTLVNRCLRLRPEPTTCWCCPRTPSGSSWPGSKPPYATWPAAGRVSMRKSRHSTGRLQPWSEPPHPSSSNSTASASNSPGSSLSQPATTQTASTPRQPSPNSAVSHYSPQAADDPPCDTFIAYYNNSRPHRSLNRRTPVAAYQARPKAIPTGSTPAEPQPGVRRDVVDADGKLTLHTGRLHHIGVGRTHARTPILMLINGIQIRIIHATTGEIIRELTLNPAVDYQARSVRNSPTKPS
jgi:hypothetical protein